jgi:hypothetical protein
MYYVVLDICIIPPRPTRLITLITIITQAIAPNPYTNLLNVYIQFANKMGFKKKVIRTYILILVQGLFQMWAS